MNERIQELAEQCTEVLWRDGPYEREEFNKEKFAELIVKECGHLMVDIMLYGGVAPEQGYDIMMKHFGVEE